MNNQLQAELLPAERAMEQMSRLVAANGLRYAVLGEGIGTGNPPSPHTSGAELLRLVNAVPSRLAAALGSTTYAFVPLALSSARLRGEEGVPAPGSDATLVATHNTPELAERAICHRNAQFAGADYVFLSTGLQPDSFALAFEFFINVAHDLVDIAGMPASFGELLTGQVAAGFRGETSMDAWEHRAAAFGAPPADEAPARTRAASASAASAATPRAGNLSPAERERARTDYQNSAFADAVAIYLLSVFLDFDYADLREREYPLLAPPALAARLRAIHALYPPGDGYTFQILYRRRG